MESNSFAIRAPILICVIAKKKYSIESQNYNRLHLHDRGAANENMFLESFNQGLIMREMGEFNVNKAKKSIQDLRCLLDRNYDCHIISRYK